MGVTIVNHQPTHHSPVFGAKTIDHITTTHPTLLTNVTTIVNGASDHSMLSCIRVTKAPIIQPRYRTVRDYRNMDQTEMKTNLLFSPFIKDATFNTDPTIATSSLQQGIRESLDNLAPQKKDTGQKLKNTLHFPSHQRYSNKKG